MTKTSPQVAPLPALNLAAAALDLHAAVDRFKAYVEVQKKENPEHWPETMDDGQWFEQFMSFMTLGLDGEV